MRLRVPNPMPLISCLVVVTLLVSGCAMSRENGFLYDLSLAKQGDAQAQLRVGVEYGRRKDFSTARKWLEKSANQGNPEAATDLAYIESYGLDGPKDLQKAYAWVTKAAKVGDPQGQYLKGYMQLDGSGDGIENGLKLIKTASSHGYMDASFFLGNLYAGRSELKLDVAKDLTKARYYYGLASKSGHPKAPFLYALMCEAGQGGPVDLVEAYVWYGVGEDLHDPQAQGKALNLTKRMEPDDVGVAYQRALGRRLIPVKKQLGLR